MSAEQKGIPFNRPAIVGRELEYIDETVRGMHTSGDGEYTRKCSTLLAEALSVPKVQLTPSCTDALEACAILLNIEPGDEIIVPSFSFVSTVNAFALRGAKPVFADVRPDTLNIDEGKLESLISPRTRAIVIVNYAGVGCEMDTILEIAERHGVAVVEDNAHGLFGKFKDRYLGTFGGLATLSFHETKNFTCGEGGGLLINDPRYLERAEIVRDKGTNRQRFLRGQVDKYTWVDLGSSFALSDILAAFLYAQLQARDAVIGKRQELWRTYDARLRDWSERHGVQVPFVPPHCAQAYHMYYLILPSMDVRQSLIAHLKRDRIDAVFHYTPLHLSEMGRTYGGAAFRCPVSKRVSETLLRLPFHHYLSAQDQERVVSHVESFFGGGGG
jgi:dTDP-4-amino-4,6-dideoxygalactose transaminase